MSLHKECADYLRANYNQLTGRKLSARHAHELVAAYFGYTTAAALRSEGKYPLTALGEAEFLMPDLHLMDRRVHEITTLPADLPSVDRLATQLSDFLSEAEHFSGDIWQDRRLDDHVNTFIQNDPMMIENDLSGEIASTNAYFDELYIDDYVFAPNDEALVVTLTGSLNGENDQDRAFHGDKIAFTTVMTFDRVAYRRPDLETSGSVDEAMYYDVSE